MGKNMSKQRLQKILENGLVALDGATGTELTKEGMPAGVSPEGWVFDNPAAIIKVQKSYVEAGSDIIYTPTFGGNRIKLDEFGLGSRVHEINKKLAELSREAAGDKLVLGNMAPTGKLIYPLGDISFDEAVAVFKEQAKALLDGGVDGFAVETMIDIQEARAAMVAIKEISSDLPIMISMTYGEDGKTLVGTDPISALITLQALGADVVGCNCSTGPGDMLTIIKHMKPYAKVPLLAKPNAGIPKLIEGKAVFSMEAEEFGSFVPKFIEHGANILGGCCGTSAKYIEQIVKGRKGLPTQAVNPKHRSALSSSRMWVTVDHDQPMNIVGERINPTGKKALQAELREGNTTMVKQFALEQEAKGATILDVNMGLSGIDEREMMIKSVSLLSQSSKLPLCIDTTSPAVMEAALKIYPGRALVNSISAEKEKLEKILPIAAKYGAMIIILPLTDQGIPKTAKERIEVVKKVFSEAQKYGYQTSDIAIDGLLMPISSQNDAGKEALDLIEWSSRELGANTICGLSNISFGLPQRKWINSTFLAMATARGLTMAIANPSSELLIATTLSSNALLGKDRNLTHYVNYFKEPTGGASYQETSFTVIEKVYTSVINGDEDKVESLLQAALDQGVKPSKLVDDALTSAIAQVGKYFDRKEFFLPQLIMSANTMSKGFNYLEPLLKDKKDKKHEADVTVILATVKGDIHDIGKNIVALMLKNYNFNVVDLGKDVAAETIIEAAKSHSASVIGLSALMTTTMTEMKKVIDLSKKQNMDVKFVVGGAVVDQHYANDIGAHGYAADAVEAVRLVERLALPSRVSL